MTSRRPPSSPPETSASFAPTRGSSGPLKRDRVMGAVAFARGVRDGYVRDLEHPDHPLGGDDVTAARGQLRVVFDRRTNLLLSSDVDHQDGTPLTFNKVLVVKPGFQFDNPPDLPRRSILRARLESHAAVRRERAADDGAHAVHHAGQPDGVSTIWTANSSWTPTSPNSIC